jgi:hypothetical protein
MEETTGTIRVLCWQQENGNCVNIYSPWTSDDDDYFDVTINNLDGDMGMACTGEEDYYCAVTAYEASVFAWEIQLACSIYRNWQRFWNDPEAFLENMQCPVGSYPVELIFEN